MPRISEWYILSTKLYLSDRFAEFVPATKTCLKTHKITIQQKQHKNTFLQDLLYVHRRSQGGLGEPCPPNF